MSASHIQKRAHPCVSLARSNARAMHDYNTGDHPVNARTVAARVLSPASDVLNCAAALMDLRGHSNDGPGHIWGDKALCALEAIALADGRRREDWSVPSPHGTTAIKALAEAIGDPPPDYFDFEDADSHSIGCVIVYCFNDRPERTKQEVTAMMRTAAAMLKAREPQEVCV